MNQLVAQSLTDDEIDEMVTLAENTFGLLPGNVEASVNYDIIGTITVTSDSELSNDELASSLKTSSADALNIHPRDVAIEIDENGVATYTISSESAEDASDLQTSLRDDVTTDALITSLSTRIPSITDVPHKNFISQIHILALRLMWILLMECMQM